MESQEHEAAIARAFILPERRDRFLSLAGSRKTDLAGRPSPKELKRRQKFVSMMANLEHWLDPRVERVSIQGDEPRAAAPSQLARLGAPETCYVMSESHEIDGREMSLREALAFLSGRYTYGSLLSCRPGALAYYEQSESPKLSMILVARGGKG